MTKTELFKEVEALAKENILATTPYKDDIITEELLKHVYTDLAHKKAQYRMTDETEGYKRIPKADEIQHFMSHYMSQMQLSQRMFHPIEYAVICHKRFLEICPFPDYNEEVAHWLLNHLLTKAGYGAITIAPGERAVYREALAAAQHPCKPDLDPLIIFVLNCLIVKK